MKKNYTQIIQIILGVVKRNPLFLREIEWKNNGFLFTTPNIFNTFYNAQFLTCCPHHIVLVRSRLDKDSMSL